MLVKYSEKSHKADVERLRLPRPTPFLDEEIKDETQLNKLCDKLGPEGCKLALGRIILKCDAVQANILDRVIRDVFPRLKGIRGAVKRSRDTIIQIDNNVNAINLKELANPAHTIRNYISRKLPKEQQAALFDALTTVENELGHDN